MRFLVYISSVIGKVQRKRKKGRTVTPSRRLQAKGEMFTLQMRKDQYNPKDLSITLFYMILCFQEILKKFILSRFQLYARAYVRIDSYFKKLSEKVHATIPILWVVLSSLFFKEILNNGERGHGRMFVSAKGEQQKSELRQLQCQGQSIYHIQYYLSGLSRTRFFRQPFS